MNRIFSHAAEAGLGGLSAALRLPESARRLPPRRTFNFLRGPGSVGALPLDRAHFFRTGPTLPPGMNSAG